MRHKTVYRTPAVILSGFLFIILCDSANARPDTTKANYKVRVRNQVGTALERFSLANNRVMLDLEQRYQKGDWLKANASGRLRIEGAYANNDELYSPEQGRRESSEISVRDTFVQMKNDAFSIKLGYQQVVWGEAFGFFYADFINPKDIRESLFYGLFDQADFRDTIPLANMQWFGESTSLQLVYVPFASKNRLPYKASPFNPLSTGNFDVNPNDININEKAELVDGQGDYGARIAKSWDGLDFGIMYFSYIDRMPYYTVTGISGTTPFLSVRETQNRIQSYGLTTTYDWSGYLLRLEAIATQGRRFNIVDNTQFMVDDEYEQFIGVVNMDFPEYEKMSMSLQIAGDFLKGDATPIIREKEEVMVALRLAYEISHNQHGEFFHFLDTRYLSSVSTFQWRFVRSPQLEYLLGVESSQGHSRSQFGYLAPLSRILVGFRGYFDG